MKTFNLQDRKTKNVIQSFLALNEAENMLQTLERQDKEDGVFTPNWYEIVENKTKDRIIKKEKFKDLGFFKFYLSGKKKLVFNKSLKTIREDLNLYDCDLSEIDFRNIESIKGDLNLGRNKLSSINFKNIKSLGDVYLGNNELTLIDFKNLKSIGILDLYNNKLTDIDFKSITKIGDLNLSNNKLYSIDLKNIKSLGVLYLENNRF